MKMPVVGHLVKQGSKHKINIESRNGVGKQRKTHVTDFRGKITEVISSAFDAHFVNATGDRLLVTTQSREGGVRGDIVNYHGWVKWNGAIWVTCQAPIMPRSSRKKKREERGLFDDNER
jgi:hypothetical protein